MTSAPAPPETTIVSTPVKGLVPATPSGTSNPQTTTVPPAIVLTWIVSSPSLVSPCRRPAALGPMFSVSVDPCWLASTPGRSKSRAKSNSFSRANSKLFSKNSTWT